MTAKSDLERVKQDWDLDFGKRVLQRQRFGPLRWVKELLAPTRYTVEALYVFVREQLDSEEGIVLCDAFDRDSYEPAPGIPRRYELNDKWTIPKEDLRTLTGGPLTKKGELLVAPRGFDWWLWIYRVSALVSIVGFIWLVVAAFL